MHGITRVTSTALALMLAAGNTAAQTCLGHPSFSNGRIQLAAAAQFGNHATVLGGEIALGKESGLFGRVGVGHETLDFGGSADNPSGIVFGGALGYQIALGGAGRVQLCPVISGNWGKLDLTDDAKLTRSQVQFGAMFGLGRAPGTGLRVVPFGGLSFAQLSRDIDVEDFPGSSFGTDTYFPLTLGLGLHFKPSFALVGDVTIPLDLGGGDPSFGIRAVFPLGGR